MEILNIYFSDIRPNRGLSKDETKDIAISAKAGSKSALNKLIKNHLLLVVKIARKYQNKGVALNELIAEGNVGLLTALEMWSPDKGSSYTTVASWYIKQSIIRNCMHNNRIVRLPEHISELMKDERIPYKYSEIEIDHPNEDGNTLADIIHDDKKFDIFIQEDENLTMMKLKKFLDVLSEREKEIIEMIYGLNGKEQFDVKQISEQFDITTTRIKQIIRLSMKKMKDQIQLA